MVVYSDMWLGWWIVIDLGVSLLSIMCRNEIMLKVMMKVVRCEVFVFMFIVLNSGWSRCVKVGLFI